MDHRYTFKAIHYFLWLVFVFYASCSAPRNITQSGKVTPRGEFKVGTNFAGNISSQPIKSLGGVTRTAVEALANRDSIKYDQQVDMLAKAALAYSLDPLSANYDIYIRYGVISRLDVGYKYGFGTHIFDAMYQFLGPTGTIGGITNQRWYGSIGLQYSGQRLSLPGSVLINRVRNYLDYGARRRDLLIPFVFSRSFGPEEEFGNVSFGIAYNHTFVEYSFNPENLYRQTGNTYTPVQAISGKNNYGAFGIFVNAKVGYRWAYLVPAISIYYQNYGRYQLLADSFTKLSGITIIPSLGLQFHLSPRKIREAASGSN
jgi:hypothetical protein